MTSGKNNLWVRWGAGVTAVLVGIGMVFFVLTKKADSEGGAMELVGRIDTVEIHLPGGGGRGAYQFVPCAGDASDAVILALLGEGARKEGSQFSAILDGGKRHWYSAYFWLTDSASEKVEEAHLFDIRENVVIVNPRIDLPGGTIEFDSVRKVTQDCKYY